MNDGRLLRAIKRIVLGYCGDEPISLYGIGSYWSHEMIPSSDVDLVGVMKPSFDFRREAQINIALNRKIRSAHKIDFGTMSYDEFFGGATQGSLMRYVELPIFLSFLKQARRIYGKRIDFSKLRLNRSRPRWSCVTTSRCSTTARQTSERGIELVPIFRLGIS